jgi:hypothetical protein
MLTDAIDIDALVLVQGKVDALLRFRRKPLRWLSASFLNESTNTRGAGNQRPLASSSIAGAASSDEQLEISKPVKRAEENLKRVRPLGCPFGRPRLPDVMRG